MPGAALKCLKLKETDFAPVVLLSYYFSGAGYAPNQRLRERFIFDYELELITESNGSMVIDDKRYDLQTGDIVFRKPGQYTQGTMPYSCFAIFIDITGRMGKNPGSYDMHEEQEYQPLFKNHVLDGIPVVSKTSPEQNYQELFSEILNEFINPKPGSFIRSRALVLELFHRLYRNAINPCGSLKTIAGAHYHTLKRVLDFIDKHQHEKLDLSMLASVAGLSPNYFHAVFSKVMGTTPNAYMTDLRIRRAKELLAGTSRTISEISELCGFDNIPYFSFLFNKKTGQSPSEFRKKHSPRL